MELVIEVLRQVVGGNPCKAVLALCKLEPKYSPQTQLQLVVYSLKVAIITVGTCEVTFSLYPKSKDRESITAYLQYTTYGVSQPVNIINSATLLNELDLSPIKADWRSLDHTFTRSNLLCMGGVRLFAALYKAQYAFPDFLCRHKSEMKNDRTTRFT